MKNILTIDDFKAMLECALKNIREREEEFSRLDAVIGDGDHGQAIVTAMTAVVETARKGTEFKTMLNDMGFDVMLQVSGSTSTLLGAFFLGMSDCASGTELDAEGVRRMFAGGLSNVQKQTQAKPGDKTMMDALVPAVEAMQGCKDEDIAAVMCAGADAAAVVSAVVAQEDPRAAAHELRDLILKVRPHVAPEEVPEDRSAIHALRASPPFLNIYQRV